MSSPLSLFGRSALLTLGLIAAAPTAALVAQTAAPVAPLMGNTDLETDANGDGWPDGWPSVKGNSSWENEDGNHFIRLVSTVPDKLVMLYTEVSIPEGVEALEISWRQRVSDLQLGGKSWFDARIMLEFMDADRGAVKPAPSAPATRRNTAGWENKSISFAVPPGARILKFMPSLFNVKSGTFDLDDIVIAPTDPAPILARDAERAAERQAKLERETAARQAKAADQFAASGNLISNGDFESDKRGKNWPDDWPNLKANSAWLEEDGNRFYRLTSTEPGKTVLAYRSIPIPADVRALELSLDWRITDLKPGAMPWFDSRVMMDLKDASGKKLSPGPSPVFSRGNTKDGAWQTRTTTFLVPEGAVTLDFMPSLFEVRSGTVDYDNIILKPIDPAPVIARQQEREAARAKTIVPREADIPANWPVELKVSGNRLVNPAGQEVWLQGLNVPSLEWSVGGEQVHKSVLVGIDEWKANVIRIPVKEQYWFGESQPDGGKSYRDTVDQMITLAANRGAYVVLDLHRYRAPTAKFVTFWKDAAARYKNHPAVLFDLLNEPHDTSWEVWRNGGFVGDKKTMDQAAFLTPEERAGLNGFESVGMQALLDAVRSTGARNIVVVGGLDYAYQLDGILNGYALDDTPEGNGIMYSCHIYPWKSGWQKYLLDAAAKHPILLGEVGADANKMTFMPLEQQEDWETWTPAILGLIQQYRLNWTGWCFHPKASPRMLLDWDYTPTPFWGQQAKDALAGKPFPPPDRLR